MAAASVPTDDHHRIFHDLQITPATVSHLGSRVSNYGSLYAKSGHPAYTPSLRTGRDLRHQQWRRWWSHVYNYVSGYSYEYQYIVALNLAHRQQHGRRRFHPEQRHRNSQLIQKTVIWRHLPGYTFRPCPAIRAAALLSTRRQRMAVVPTACFWSVIRPSTTNGGDGSAVTGLSADSKAAKAPSTRFVSQYVDVVGLRCFRKSLTTA